MLTASMEIAGAGTQTPQATPPPPTQTPGHEGNPQFNPDAQQAASIQALTMVGNDVVYAGSFGHGLFRSHDRGTTWSKSGQGVTDPFILSLATGKDGAVYAGTFRGGVFRSRDQGKTWQVVNNGLKRQEIKALLTVGEALYAGTADGAYRFHPTEDRWSVVTTGLTICWCTHWRSRRTARCLRERLAKVSCDLRPTRPAGRVMEHGLKIMRE